MGHTHGIKWTNELMIEKINEVKNALELDRMPSSRECIEYFNDSKLTNAISKKIGWYKLAQMMGLNIKSSETYFGKSYETRTSELLKSLGYEVRKMPQNFPYDLLVNDCVKVDVKASNLYRGDNGSFYAFNLEKPYCTCDIYMLHLLLDGSDKGKILIIPSKFVALQTQISIGEYKSKYDRFFERWDYLESFCNYMESVV